MTRKFIKQGNAKIISLVLGPALFAFVYFFYEPRGLSSSGVAVLATALWMAAWWIGEAVPISATALLPIVLFPLTGAVGIGETTASFGHKFIFLFMGGFILAIGLEKWQMHKRIALWIIYIIGADVRGIILGFMIATAFMSMWISNTATAVMMLPIGMAIVAQLKDDPETDENENIIFGKALMLAIAYSASIGGMATLIGTPPNLIFAGVAEQFYGAKITFSLWLKFGLPISILLLIICWIYISRFAFHFKQKEFPGGKDKIRQLYQGLGRISYEEIMVTIVFVSTAIFWISRAFLQSFIPHLDDTMIAIGMAFLLFIIPDSKGKSRLLSWEDAVKMPWGILLLFGGGIALAAGFESTGLAEWISGQFSNLHGLPLLVLILILIGSVNFLTEITSNLATTAMLLPVLAAMAVSLEVHPYYLMVSATVAASCAFMMPVATPPNAVVFGSGYLRIPDMIRTGLWMNFISIILLSILVYFFLPYVWDVK